LTTTINPIFSRMVFALNAVNSKHCAANLQALTGKTLIRTILPVPLKLFKIYHYRIQAATVFCQTAKSKRFQYI
jgi:hypothetical protein